MGEQYPSSTPWTVHPGQCTCAVHLSSTWVPQEAAALYCPALAALQYTILAPFHPTPPVPGSRPPLHPTQPVPGSRPRVTQARPLPPPCAAGWATVLSIDYQRVVTLKKQMLGSGMINSPIFVGMGEQGPPSSRAASWWRARAAGCLGAGGQRAAAAPICPYARRAPAACLAAAGAPSPSSWRRRPSPCSPAPPLSSCLDFVQAARASCWTVAWRRSTPTGTRRRAPRTTTASRSRWRTARMRV
jgi:hypothetical protein